jgi:hypothetical protein
VSPSDHVPPHRAGVITCAGGWSRHSQRGLMHPRRGLIHPRGR